MHAHFLDRFRQQGLRTDGTDFGGTERGQRMNVGARHPRMQDVADDGNGQIGEILLVVTDRVHVEQTLRRVRVAAVAGIDHVHVGAPDALQMLGDQVGRARRRMANDEHVGVHGDQVVDGVEQRFALGGRRAADVEIDDVGRQTFGGDFEGRAGARRVLEEQVENALAAQQWHFLYVAIGNLEKARRRYRESAPALRAASRRSTAGASARHWH